MKVVADENIPFIKEAFADFGDVVTVHGRSITREICNDTSILLVRSITPVNKELLEGTSVKFVATATIGFDHVDINYFQEANIGFGYAPGSNADSVAEYVIAALMVCTKKMGKSFNELTLGIIGAGNVGSKVFHHAELLGIHCLINDPPKKRLTGSDIYLSRDEVLRNSDIVTIHVPLNNSGEDATYRMVDSNFIAMMKKGAVLINTSRGKVVDEHQLRNGAETLGGIVLDVWENEPSINNKTITITDIATSHIAGYSFDGKIRGTLMIYQSACAYFFKRPVWSIPEHILHENAGTIDIRDSKDPFSDAVLKAYPILKDDIRESGFLTRNSEEQALLFDSLRKNYQKRFEFSHYSVICGKHQSREAVIFSELGFKVEIK